MPCVEILSNSLKFRRKVSALIGLPRTVKTNSEDLTSFELWSGLNSANRPLGSCIAKTRPDLIDPSCRIPVGFSGTTQSPMSKLMWPHLANSTTLARWTVTMALRMATMTRRDWGVSFIDFQSYGNRSNWIEVACCALIGDFTNRLFGGTGLWSISTASTASSNTSSTKARRSRPSLRLER